MDTKTKRLLMFGGVLAAFTFFIFISALFPQPQRQVASPGPKSLTEDETRLPDEKPQHLVVNTGKTGTLVVTANLNGGYVFIDQEAQVLPEGHGKIQSAPLYPPFRIEALLVGKHTIIALRDGSPRQEIGFEIRENEATRVQIIFTQRY